MLPNVITAYKKQGYTVDFGSPARLYSTVIDNRNNRTVNCSGGFTVSDAFLFQNIARLITADNVLVIGNSFGLSTFVLADLFPGARIDAIDAELENVEPQLGSEITRRIAADRFPNVHLTIGFSPQDLPKAAEGRRYNFIFVDAMHTSEAVLLDYKGIGEMVASDCIIYFHDMANCNMLDAWSVIRKDGTAKGYRDFEFGFTQMGCTALVKGYPDLTAYLENISNGFSGPYLNGYTGDNMAVRYKRPFFWDLSFGQIETLVRKRLKRIF